ncbi:MAG: hypothetical protein ACQEW8_09335 [Actinomycetota bacterium]
MTTLPRLRRAFRGDIRFFIGISLVILSMVGVWLVVTTSSQTTAVLQMTRTIVPGETITTDDVQPVEVNLGTVTGYLEPGELDDDLIAVETLNTGELVPTGGVADSSEGRTTTIVLESTVRVPTGVSTGSVVELWHAPALADDDGYDRPRILVADAVVAVLRDAEGMLAQGGSSVEVVVDRSDVAEVLAAIADGAALSIVPVRAG